MELVKIKQNQQFRRKQANKQNKWSKSNARGKK